MKKLRRRIAGAGRPHPVGRPTPPLSPHACTAGASPAVQPARATTLPANLPRPVAQGSTALRAAGIAALATALPAPAMAHGVERGLILLLPTGYYLAGAAVTVAATFAALALVPAGWFRQAEGAVLALWPARALPRTGPSLASFALLAVLVATGVFAGSDPLTNPLPLVIWTFWWVGFPLLIAMTGNLWPWLNPWTGPLALLARATGGRIGADALLPYPAWLGYLPALILFALFAWYENVSLAPDYPPRLAGTVALYWLFTFGAMILFGEAAWAARGEPFSILFRLIGLLAPIHVAQAHVVPAHLDTAHPHPIHAPQTESAAAPTPTAPAPARGRVALSWPGQRILAAPPLPLGGLLFVLLTLGTASFDGFSETFTWFRMIGVNPLDFHGRSSVTGVNTAGIAAAPVLLGLLFFAAVGAGAAAAGERAPARVMRLAGQLAYSILPIWLAFHASHYMTMLIVNGQYLWAALSDPFGRGWNLFGTADWHVTTSLMTNLDTVRYIWSLQVLIVVAGHVLGIVLAHMIAMRHFGDTGRAARSQIGLAAVMVFYTVFGLWLLSTPTMG